MKFKNLTLYTDALNLEKEFYIHTLGFPLEEDDEHSFSVGVGWSCLTFIKSLESHRYHYCFLIPSNQLDACIEWMQTRTELIEITPNTYIQEFTDWNASSIYFRDGSGNIVEFIVRYDLNNNSYTKEAFDCNEILGVNEIGMPTQNIRHVNTQLQQKVGTTKWKGNDERFSTHGDQEGIFLLPNYLVKKEWFPTTDIIHPEPFQAIIEHHGNEFQITYQDEKLMIDKKTPNN